MKDNKPKNFKNYLLWYIIGIVIFIIPALIIVFCYKHETQNLLEILTIIAGFFTVLFTIA